MPFRLGSYTLYTTNRWKPADPLQLFLQKDQSQLLGDRLSFKVYILQVDPRTHHCSPVFWSILIDGVDALHIWIKVYIRGIGVNDFSGVSVVSACSQQSRGESKCCPHIFSDNFFIVILPRRPEHSHNWIDLFRVEVYILMFLILSKL